MSDRVNSLGFAKPESATRVVVAMSGGVDSSVVAALLKDQGYDVVGVTLQLYDHGAAVQRTGACCAGQDIYDARQVADRIGIAHYVLDYESRFKAEVIDAFADAYANGETPVPCVTCNKTVKFRDLLATARDLGADALATGHYVRRTTDALGRPQMRRGAEDARDQSYFLFGTTTEQLGMLRFPLGDMSKAETRRVADRFGLPVASKPDSQDICFVPNGDYAAVVERLRPEAGEPGDIVDLNGVVVGAHRGVMRFTVGQRRGIDLGLRRGSDNEPLYVVRIEPRRRRIVVGPRSALGRRALSLREANWLGEPPGHGARVLARVRSSQPPQEAEIRRPESGQCRVEFGEPLIGAAPGQACVLYDFEEPDRMLGGGWIERDDSVCASP